ncbi:gasdermin-C [Orycteropus afer afer]|uniref:Gasdermin-C n=1 Tax=Orycteropus afer afer TaxID=1230840 RepID=A0A8B7A102_ORYAF|nr:gasdermin-C [Orycteropus afer afer]
MTSMFERYVKNLLKEVGRGDLKPINNLSNATKFHQFNVIRKKKANFLSRFWKQPDIPTEFSLMDILEPNSSVPETVSTKPFLFNITEFQKHKGGVDVEVNIALETSVSGEATAYQESSLELQFVRIPPHTWTALQKRGLEKEPGFLKECRNRKENLYVVTEIMKLTKSTMLHEMGRVDSGGKCSFSWNPYVKGEVQGEGLRVTKKMLTLPESTVMAYQRKQLVIMVDGWDFKCLQKEISQEMEVLASFPKNLRDIIFHNILAMLGDRGALQDLMDMMEENSSGHLDGPGGTILNELQENTKDLLVSPKYCILYILGAIMVLSDTQHDLLAQSMEMRILAQQRELVRDILETNFTYAQSTPFTLKAELLAPLQGEAAAITHGLLEECGLTTGLKSLEPTGDLEANGPLCALYGALSVLQQLADP